MAGEHESPTRDQDYQSYLLRLWRATCDGETVWRASLESPHTGERTAFASLRALFRYLKEQTAHEPPIIQMDEGGVDKQ